MPFDPDAVKTLLERQYVADRFVFHYAYRSLRGFASDLRSSFPFRPLARHGVYEFGYVKAYAQYFETARRVFTKEWGFQVPKGNGQRGRIEVGFGDLEGADGLTRARRAVEPRPEIWVKSRYENPDGFYDLPAMQATAAHELFHAVQFGYLGTCRREPWVWWMEATAVFMESAVFPGTSDYRRYLYAWLDSPDLPLDDIDGWREYGSVLWCQYLVRRFGRDIVRDTWQRASTFNSALDALNTILSGRGETFTSPTSPDVLGDFVLSNYTLPDEPRFFQHAFVEGVYQQYPVPPIEGNLDHLAARYYLFVPDSTTPQFALTLGVSSPPGTCPLKAVVAEVLPDGCLVNQTSIYPAWDPASSQFVGRSATLPFQRPMLVVVINSTWTTNGVPYRIIV